GRLRLLDEGDGRGPGVDGGVVIDAGAEEGNHPLVDGVLAVVALPVGEAGAGDGSAEAVGLGDGEHGHEAAVAPAGDALAGLVDGEPGLDGVHALEDVSEVAVAVVLAVGHGELFTLTEAAARVGIEDEVTLVRPHVAGGGGRAGRGGGAAVDFDDERVLFGGVVVLGEGEPALDVEAFVLPLDGFEAGTGGGLGGVVEVSELGALVAVGEPDFGRVPGAPHGEGDALAGDGDGVLDLAAGEGDLAQIGGDDLFFGVGVPV